MILMEHLRGKLEKNLVKMCDEFPGVMGISLKSLETDRIHIFVNGDETFPIGSMIKVPILVEFFRRVEAGSLDGSRIYTYKKEHMVGGSGVIQYLSPDEVVMPLIDYATLMINVSDNVATNIIIDLLGTEKINQTLNDLGLKTTIVQRKMLDWESAAEGKENISTPIEITQLMSSLYNRVGLSSNVCVNTLEILKKPKTGFIRNSVPITIEIADKWGTVKGAVCDVGIVFLPKLPYIITVMTKHIPISDVKNANTISVIKTISKLVYDFFLELSLATGYGRKI